jgi:predicted DNA-binding transcriptional regulator
MNSDELEVLSLLFSRMKDIGIEELQSQLGIPINRVRGALEDLFQKGYIHYQENSCFISEAGSYEAGSRWG